MPYAEKEMQQVAQAISFVRRYRAPTRKGKAFRRSESERKKEWQATPEGAESNRERQRRYREKLAMRKKNAASAMQGKKPVEEPSQASRRWDAGGKLMPAKMRAKVIA